MLINTGYWGVFYTNGSDGRVSTVKWCSAHFKKVSVYIYISFLVVQYSDQAATNPVSLPNFPPGALTVIISITPCYHHSLYLKSNCRFTFAVENDSDVSQDLNFFKGGRKKAARQISDAFKSISKVTILTISTFALSEKRVRNLTAKCNCKVIFSQT